MTERTEFLNKIQIKKIDLEKRLVDVIYSKVTDDDGNPVIDSQGDIIPIDVLEDADIEAFADGGLRKGGEMHTKIGGADIVQHYTLSKEQMKAFGFGANWEGGIAKLRITDDALWQKVKKGELPELSIAGEGIREAVE